MDISTILVPYLPTEVDMQNMTKIYCPSRKMMGDYEYDTNLITWWGIDETEQFDPVGAHSGMICYVGTHIDVFYANMIDLFKAAAPSIPTYDPFMDRSVDTKVDFGELEELKSEKEIKYVFFG